MKLSKRLQAIADLIIKYKHGHILGDIGTDHAYLPCYLVSQHDFSKAYACDIAKGPIQASIETILKVDLYGTAVLLEEVGKVIAYGGSGITISSQSGHRLPALSPETDELLATTPSEDLLSLDILRKENIRDTLHAYQLAKRCNVKRVMAEAVKWGERGARINSISPGIIITPLAIDELNGIRGEFYKNMFARCPAGRPGTADEIAHLAELILSEKGAFITGSDFLIDGGATASYFYGPLNPNKNGRNQN